MPFESANWANTAGGLKKQFLQEQATACGKKASSVSELYATRSVKDSLGISALDRIGIRGSFAAPVAKVARASRFSEAAKFDA